MRPDQACAPVEGSGHGEEGWMWRSSAPLGRDPEPPSLRARHTGQSSRARTA